MIEAYERLQRAEANTDVERKRDHAKPVDELINVRLAFQDRSLHPKEYCTIDDAPHRINCQSTEVVQCSIRARNAFELQNVQVEGQKRHVEEDRGKRLPPVEVKRREDGITLDRKSETTDGCASQDRVVRDLYTCARKCEYYADAQDKEDNDDRQARQKRQSSARRTHPPLVIEPLHAPAATD